MRQPLTRAWALLSILFYTGCICVGDDGDTSCTASFFVSYLTGAAYGERRPLPDLPQAVGCGGLACSQGANCRLVQENGGFDLRDFGSPAHWFGDPLVSVDLATTPCSYPYAGASSVSESDGRAAQWYQSFNLDDLLLPEERGNTALIRVRAVANFTTDDHLGAPPRVGLHLAAYRGRPIFRGPDPELFPAQTEHYERLELHEAFRELDGQTNTWEPLRTEWRLPAGVDFFVVTVEAYAQEGAEVDVLVDDVAVAIDRGNAGPSAAGDFLTTPEDVPVDILPIANDRDSDGELDPSTFAVVDAPDHGTITGTGFTPDGEFRITYLPRPEYFGPDAFIYTVADDDGVVSNEAEVRIAVRPVNDAPVASDDDYPLSGNLLLVPAPGVLLNDADVEGDPLAAVLVQDVQHGSLTFGENGGFSYSAGAGFPGIDHFVYRARDGSLESEPVTVTITGEGGTYDLALRHTMPAVASEGDPVPIWLEVVNAGPHAAAGVAVTDVLPAGLVFDRVESVDGSYDPATGVWSIGAIPVNTGAFMQLITIATTPGDWTNTATITAGLGQGDNPANNTGGSTVTVHDVVYDLRVITTAMPNPVAVDASITFTVHVSNLGPITTGRDTIRVTAPLPPGFAYVSDNWPESGAYDPGTGVWTLGPFLSGSNALVITATALTAGTRVFTATITGALQDTNSDNNQSDVEVTVQ